jgi:hypothetical protein
VARHDEEMLAAAERLLERRSGQRGVLASARVRRAISTAYYALFHFLLGEAARTLIGSHHDLRRRRRVFVRSFSHGGIKAALDKVRGTTIDASVADFLRPRGGSTGAVATPPFARALAANFSMAQSQRNYADYDLNTEMGAADGHALIVLDRQTIDKWQAADTPADRDFKHALCVLMLLQGRLRRDN